MTKAGIPAPDPDRVERAFERVFIPHERERAYGPILLVQPGLAGRGLMYPAKFQLSSLQFHTLALAARSLYGERSFFLRLLEPYVDMESALEMSFEDFDAYLATDADYIESCLLSVEGRWGVHVTDAAYALIGAEPTFLDRVAERLPLEDQAQEFLRNSRLVLAPGAIEPPSWLRVLADNLYGEAEAASVLRGAGYRPLGT